MLLAGASDLVVVFLGLEVMSVAVYVLAGYDRRSAFSAEAALKYFLIGAFASGVPALRHRAGVRRHRHHQPGDGRGAVRRRARCPVMGALGLGLLLIGFLFKVAAVPFHMWAPDVYDGAPTPVTGFMATGVKAAGFLALARLLFVTFPANAALWQPVLGILAILTMVAGNLVALTQRSLKRMLAYSSVAHAGYLLAAVWPGDPHRRRRGPGLPARLRAHHPGRLRAARRARARRRAGRHGRRPRRAWPGPVPGRPRPSPSCCSRCSGFPGTFGFIGKWMILSALVTSGQWLIPVVLVLASVVSAGYYLPIIMAMYMKPPREGVAPPLPLPRAAGVVVLLIVGDDRGARRLAQRPSSTDPWTSRRPCSTAPSNRSASNPPGREVPCASPGPSSGSTTSAASSARS